MRKYRNYIVGFFVVVVLMFFALTGTVSAAIPTTFSSKSQRDALINVRNKVIYTLISDCYESLTSPITIDSGYTTWEKLFNNGNAKYNIPYYLFDNAKVKSTRKMTCAEIMGGWKNFLGTQSFPGRGYKEKDIPVVDENGNFFGSKEEMILFLTEKLNYKPSADAQKEVDGRRCVFYQGSTENGKRYATDKLCATQSVDDENKIDLKYGITREDVSSDDLGSGNLDTLIFKIKEVSYDEGMNINNKKTNVLAIPFVGYNTWVFTGGKWAPSASHASSDNYAGCSDLYLQSSLLFWSNPDGVTFHWCYYRGFLRQQGKFRVEGVSEMTFEDLADALGAAILTAKNNEPSNFPRIEQMNHLSGDVRIEPALATVLEKCTREEYMTYFLGADYESFGRSLTETEKYVLYQKGLKSGENSLTESGVADGKGNVKYWLVGEKFYGPNKYNLTCSSDCKVATLVGDKIELLQKIEGSNPTILKLINALDFESEDFGEVEEPPEDLEEEITDMDSSQVCYNGSGPVGWLVCPLVKIISGIGYDLWLNVRESFMVIPANMFDDGAGLKAVWEVVRNIANIIFIILFLIVIFSQLTGVGIDNYGIKKILPRLVVVAILANVSWIICELVSDVSNIVGFGIESLLTNAASNVPIPSNSLQTTQLIVGGVGDLALAGAGGYIFVLLSGGGLVGAAALGLAVLGVVISIVSGIIIMYLILVVREIGIVLTIALAPVAIVCYALPNTEKHAKQWFNIFKALLVVFPLCGAAIGAGKLASAVLAAIAVNDPGTSVALGAISSGDFVEASRIFAAGGVNRGLMVAALVAQVVPFFLIPSLLKKSLALIGNIGAKISSAGRRASRGFNNKIDSGIRNSRGYKALEAASQSGRDMKWASRTLGKYPKNMNPDDIKSPIKRSKYIRALRMRTAYNADQDVAHSLAISKNAEEKRYGEELARMQNREDVYERLKKAAITEGNAEEAGAAFDEMENRGGINELLEFAEDRWDDMNSDVQNRLLQKFGASKIDAFKKFNKYRSSGGTGSFHEWVRGEFKEDHIEKDRAAKVKPEISSYGASLMSREPDVMVGFDKDEFKFLNRRNKDGKKYGLKGSIGDGQELDDALLGKMANQAMLKSNDVEARAAARKMFCEGIAEGTMRVEEAGFTAATLGKMHSSDAKALREAQAEYFKKKKLNEVQSRAEKFQDSRYEKEVDARARRYDNDNEEVQTYAQHFDGDVMKAKRQLAMEQMAADEMAVEEIQTKLAPQIANIDSIVRSNMNQESIDLLGIGGIHSEEEIDDTGGGSSAREISAVGSVPTEVPASFVGKSYEDVRFDSEMPSYVKNKDDYATFIEGIEARKELSKVQGMSFSDFSKVNATLPPELATEQQYDLYKANLQERADALDDLRAYRSIQNIRYDEAIKPGSGVKVSRATDERRYATIRDNLQERIETRNERRRNEMRVPH